MRLPPMPPAVPSSLPGKIKYSPIFYPPSYIIFNWLKYTDLDAIIHPERTALTARNPRHHRPAR